MTVDYAKRPSSHRDNSRLSAVIFIVALLSLAVGSLILLKWHEKHFHKNVSAVAGKTVPVTKAANDTQKNQFDFYSILPKTQKI